MCIEYVEALKNQVVLSGAPNLFNEFFYKLRHWPPGTDKLPFVPPFFARMIPLQDQ